MDKLIIPPNPNWFVPSICYCTPDNGLIYGATNKIVYLNSHSEATTNNPVTKILDLRKKLNCFAINPEWRERQLLAIMNIENHVLIYDFATGMAIKGHKGHSNSFIPNQTQYSSIVFTSPSQVISSFNSEIIQFCLNTNKYNIFPDFTSRNPITTMKIAPNHSGILAAGTRNGLVLLIDYENMNIIARMRGHDMEITSLDFLIVSSKSVDPLSQKPQKLQQQDDSDLFDIYSYEKVENEFGVYQETKEDLSDDEEDNNAEIQEKLHNTSNFNFLEECNTLKETILNEGGNDDINNESKSKIVSYEESQEQYRSNNAENISIDLSNETNKSSHTPVLTEESLNYAEECQRMKNDFQPKSEESIILVSGSRECTVWLWNVDEHRALKSIKWHPKSAKSALPAVFTNVLWIDQETLLITDNNGDIIEHKIRFDEKLTAIKDNKQKKSNNFDCKGVLSFCKSTDDSSLWVISIHRNICLFNATIANVKEKKEEKRYQKVISLDTLQYRVHCLIENPIDSHVIAIGGNDKRICLWNTSDPNHHTIILKPFMNKIQSGVLALCWHPQKDNLLAFGTREGRIGVLDTNKTTNVPIILQSFSSHEIYSLAWANFYKKTQGEEGGEKEKNEVILLLACSGGKLVYYTQKDYKLHHLKEFTEINSISTSCGSTSESKNHLIALGTNTGDLLICDMSCDFRILMQRKLSKKYVGMICWWENKRLACSSDAGVTLIRDVDKFMNDGGGEENVITLSNHKGRVYSVRFNKAGDQVVACCMHGYVDVWCVNEGRLVASLNIETPAYTAIFMPHNENTIICGGQDSTVFAFEWQKYSTTHSTTTAAASSSTSMQSMKREINSTDKFKNIEWATISELTTVSKHSKRRVKKKVKENVRNGNFEEEEITKAMNAKLNLNTNKKSHSIFIAANRELTNNSLGLMEMILKRNNNDLTDAASTASNDGSFDDDDDVDDESNKRELSLNELILGNRDDVKKAIDKELKEISVGSIGTNNIILPQLIDDLKRDILERIVGKNLMETHVAVAPAVSYDLWKKCCLAYGIQLIESDKNPIQALPYLLAVNDVNTCISKLCETKHYREAWVIAKLRKEKDDPVFEKIMEKWIGYYDENGNYEIAATLLCLKRKYKRAYDVLSKRQSMPSKCAEILEMLSTKLSEATTTSTTTANSSKKQEGGN